MKFNFKIFLLFIILVFIFISFSFSTEAKKDSDVFFLNVGQGDATLIQNQNLQILIDGGRGKKVITEMQKFIPFTDRKIELLVLTHPDQDHMEGLLEVLKEYEVESILETGIVCDKDICKEWDKIIEEKGISVIYAEFGQKISFNDSEMIVIYPFENLKDKEFEDSNDSSVIIKFKTKNNTYLLTGDATTNVESELIDKNINIDADILKIGHHGSKYSTSFEFLEDVSPKQAVISVGKNSYGHPADEVINKLKNMNIDILRTDMENNIIFTPA